MKRISKRCDESRGFSQSAPGFFPQGMLTGWDRINTVKKVTSQLL